MRKGALSRLALACLVVATSIGCASASAPVTAGARRWFEGPVRWLMLPEEARAFRGLATNREALEFIDAFWKRRDPTPEDPENPFRITFFERAAAADRLYGEGERAGSLTDRGRALILLGPPPVLRYRQQAAPTLEPARSGRAEVVTRTVTLEVWEYPATELPPALAEAVLSRERRTTLTLTFAIESRRTYLLEGERLLDLAAAAVLNGGAPPGPA